eukprot:TRINITY_DN2230_c0_g2_i7.p1 TRINITY_DN2230_c0_g2~~TRINITY_DN2230_c0_g2_i7.p1  ORF type:complete len:3228 (+),score=877.55 TRINITY_DN2230_c0_g2_i7:150-9833(+)
MEVMSPAGWHEHLPYGEPDASVPPFDAGAAALPNGDPELSTDVSTTQAGGETGSKTSRRQSSGSESGLDGAFAQTERQPAELSPSHSPQPPPGLAFAVLPLRPPNGVEPLKRASDAGVFGFDASPSSATREPTVPMQPRSSASCSPCPTASSAYVQCAELTRSVGGLWAPPLLREDGCGEMVVTLAEAKARVHADSRLFGFMLKESDEVLSLSTETALVPVIFVLYGAGYSTDPDWVHYTKVDLRGDWHSVDLMRGTGGYEYQVHRVEYEGESLRAYRVPVGHHPADAEEMSILDIASPPPLLPQESLVWWTAAMPCVPSDDGCPTDPVSGYAVQRRWYGDLVFAAGSISARDCPVIQPWKFDEQRANEPVAEDTRLFKKAVQVLGCETMQIGEAKEKCLSDPKIIGFCFQHQAARGEPPEHYAVECHFYGLGADVVDPVDSPGQCGWCRYTKGWTDHTFRGTIVERRNKRPRFEDLQALDCDMDVMTTSAHQWEAGRSKLIENAKRRCLRNPYYAGFILFVSEAAGTLSGRSQSVHSSSVNSPTHSAHDAPTQELYFYTREQIEMLGDDWETSEEWCTYEKQGLCVPPPGRGFYTAEMTLEVKSKDEIVLSVPECGRVGTLRRRYRAPFSRYSVNEFKRTLAWKVFGETRRGKLGDNPYNVVDTILVGIPPKSDFRKSCVYIIDHHLFDKTVLVLISLNALTLVLDERSIPDLKDQTWLMTSLGVTEVAFQIAFTIEALLKILALGFVMHPNSYLRSYPDPIWNRMDFLIVIAGYLAYIDIGGDFTIFRLLRALRPLRTMNRVKHLRRLISTLIAAVPVAIDVFMLFFLLMWVFAILGVQLWAGVYHQRCYIEPGWDESLRLAPGSTNATLALPCENQSSPLCCFGDDQTQYYLGDNATSRPWLVFNDTDVCSTNSGGRQCSGNGVSLPQVCLINFDSYKRAIVHFDFIGTALIATLKLMSMEDWPEDMFDAQNGVGHHAWMYFFLATLLGNILAVNLILAALSTEYRHQKMQRSHKQLPLITCLSPATLLGSLLAHSVLVVAMPGLVEEKPKDDDDWEDDDEEEEEDMMFEDEVEQQQSPVETEAAPPPMGSLGASQIPQSVIDAQGVREVRQGLRPGIGSAFREADCLARQQSEEAPRVPAQLHTETPLRSCGSGMNLRRGSTLYGRRSSFGLRHSSAGNLKALALLQSFDHLAGPVWKPISPRTRRRMQEKEERKRLHREGYWEDGTFGHFAFRVTRSRVFNYTMICTTVINTVMLSMDHYRIDPTWLSAINWVNFVTSYIFLAEAILKLVGLTHRVYFTDNYNCFDLALVIVSVPDMIDPDPSGGGSGLTAMRGFRLARVFRLARKWKALNRILAQIARAVVQVGYLSIVMMLFLFIFSVMGVQLFFCSNPDSRCGFENLGMSALTVFVVITGENWVSIMKETILRSSWGAATYFITLFLLGNYILLNLFIAILIDAFADADDPDQESLCVGMLRLCPSCWGGGDGEPQAGAEAEGGSPRAESKQDSKPSEPDWVPPQDDTLRDIPAAVTEPSASPCSGRSSPASLSRTECRALRAMGIAGPVSPSPRRAGSTERSGETGLRSPESARSARSARSPRGDPFSQSPESTRRASFASDVVDTARRQSMFGSHRKTPRRGSRAALLRRASHASGFSNGAASQSPMSGRAADRRVSVFADVGTQLEMKMIPGKSTLHARGMPSRRAAERRRSAESPELEPIEEDVYEDLPDGIEKTEFASFRPSKPCDDVAGLLRAAAEPPELRDEERSHRERYESKNCCGVGSANSFRVWTKAAVNWPYFDTIVSFVIVVNLAFIAAESPATEQSRPTLFDVLRVGDYVFVALFSVEMLVKIVAWGPEGFFKDPWNGMDAFVVLTSLVGLFVTTLRGFRSLRILRLVTLGDSDMKHVLATILRSLDGIQTVFFVSTMTYFIWATVGTQLFKGALYECTNPNIKEEALCSGSFSVEQKTAFGSFSTASSTNATWVKNWFTFDDVFESMFTLFQISVGEKWREMMYRTMDAPGPEEGPRTNSNAWIAAIFFVVFVVLGQFFFVNLFIGILIQKFDESHASHRFYRDDDFSMDPRMKDAMEQWRQAQSILSSADLLDDIPSPHYIIKARMWMDDHGSGLCGYRARVPNSEPSEEVPMRPKKTSRDWELPKALLLGIDATARSSRFEAFITFAILLNSITMALQHHDQPESMDDFLFIANWVFVAVFTLEAVLKLIAFSYHYFRDGWNRFDLLIVLVSWVSVLSSTGSTSSIRVLRILRMLRLLKRAEGLKMVFNTTVNALPALVNIAMLLLFVFFIFGVFGVDLFGEIKESEELNRWSNFQNLYYALITLYQVSTTETWNDILLGTEISEPACSQALNNCGVSQRVARAFFVLFLLLGSFVFLNLFVYVLIENYEREKHARKVKDERQADLEPLRVLKELWLAHDPKGIGIIDADVCLMILQQLPEPLWLKSAWALANYFGRPTREERQAAIDFKRSTFLCTQRQLRAMLIPLNRNMQVRYHDVVRTLSLRAFGLRVREMMALRADPRDEMVKDFQSKTRFWSLHHFHAAEFVRTRWWRFRSNLREERFEERSVVRKGLARARQLLADERLVDAALERAGLAWLSWHHKKLTTDDARSTQPASQSASQPASCAQSEAADGSDVPTQPRDSSLAFPADLPEGPVPSLAAVAACLLTDSPEAAALRLLADGWCPPPELPSVSPPPPAGASSVLCQTLPLGAVVPRLAVRELGRMPSGEECDAPLLLYRRPSGPTVVSRQGWVWSGSASGGPAQLTSANGAVCSGRWRPLDDGLLPDPLGAGAGGTVATDCTVSLNGTELAEGVLERWSSGLPYVALHVERDACGRPHGRGACVTVSGAEYQGCFEEGAMTGDGELRVPEPDVGRWRMSADATAAGCVQRGVFVEGVLRSGSRDTDELVDEGVFAEAGDALQRIKLEDGSRLLRGLRVRMTGSWRGAEREAHDQGVLRSHPTDDGDSQCAEVVHLNPDLTTPVETWTGNFSLWHLQGKGAKVFETAGIKQEGMWRGSQMYDAGTITYSSGVVVHCLNFRRGRAHGRARLRMPTRSASSLTGAAKSHPIPSHPSSRSWGSFARDMTSSLRTKTGSDSGITSAGGVAIFRCGISWSGGSLEDGTPHGLGEGYLQSGIRFKGRCLMGQPRFGLATLPDGTEVYGHFQDGHHVAGKADDDPVRNLTSYIDEPEHDNSLHEQHHPGLDRDGNHLLF